MLRGPDHQERTINSNYNRWNPCVTAEVSVDVTNDGQHWRDLRVPSRHRRDSCPSEKALGGLWSKFGPIRTVSSEYDAPRMTWSPRRRRRDVPPPRRCRSGRTRAYASREGAAMASSRDHVVSTQVLRFNLCLRSVGRTDGEVHQPEDAPAKTFRARYVDRRAPFNFERQAPLSPQARGPC